MIIRLYNTTRTHPFHFDVDILDLWRPLHWQQPDVVVPQPSLTARVWPSIDTPSVRIKQKRKEIPVVRVSLHPR